MTIKRIITLIYAGVLTLTLTAGSLFDRNTTGIAYVDMEYILKNIPQYESANDQLNMISKRWQKEIDALLQEAQVLTQNYQTEQIFLSEDMKAKREAEIVAKEEEALQLKRKYFGANGELFKKRESLIKPIQDEIFTAIQDVAQEEKLLIVKDKNTDPGLIYSATKLDISDKVLEKMGISK